MRMPQRKETRHGALHAEHAPLPLCAIHSRTSAAKTDQGRPCSSFCQRVVGGRFGVLAEGSRNTLSLHIMVDRRGVEPLTSAVQTRPLRC